MNSRIARFAAYFVSVSLTSGAFAQQPELLQTLQNPTASPSDQFGQNLAADGNTLAVGELTGVSIYTVASSGSLLLEDRVLLVPGIPPSNLENLDAGLALSGDRIAVTQPAMREVRILERSGANWQQTTVVTDPLSGGAFGSDLDLDGTRLVIGESSRAPSIAQIPSLPGRAWVSELATDPNALIELIPESVPADDSFGFSVSVHGEWIAVGAPRSPILSGPPDQQGRVFFFRRDTGGNWNESQVIESNSAGPVTLGSQVQLEGSQLAILDTFPDVALPGPFASALDPGVSTYEFDGGSWVALERSSPFARGGSLVEFRSFDFDVDRVVTRTNVAFGMRSLIEQRRGVDRFVTESSLFTPGPFTTLDRYPIAYIGEYVAIGERNGASINSEPGRVEIYSSRPRNIERFCRADQGCNPCPCNGTSVLNPLGGCLNRDFRAGSIETTGRARLTADTLGVRARGLNTNGFALLLVGSNRLPLNSANCTTFGQIAPGFGVNFADSNGLRCIGGNVRRLGLRVSDLNGDIGFSAIGDSGWGADDSPPVPFAGQLFASSGQPLHLQIFYRDSGNQSCTASINTTDAITVTYLP